MVNTPASNRHNARHKQKSLLRDMLAIAAGDNFVQNSASETSQTNLLEPTIATTSSTDQVNDAPIAVDAVLTTDTDRDAILPSFLLLNDIDIDSDVLKVGSVSDAINGILVLNSQRNIGFKSNKPPTG